MIYILTGIAKSGKSLVVKEIQARMSLPVIHTDEIMIDIDKKKSLPNLDIYASDRTVAHKLEPFILSSIETNIANNDTVLYEGVHFNCPFARKLLDRFPEDIRILYLGYKDVDVKTKTQELFQYKHLIDNDWIFDHQGEQVEDIVSYLIEESARVYQECLENHLLYTEVYDITKQLNDIIDELIIT